MSPRTLKCGIVQQLSEKISDETVSGCCFRVRCVASSRYEVQYRERQQLPAAADHFIRRMLHLRQRHFSRGGQLQSSTNSWLHVFRSAAEMRGQRWSIHVVLRRLVQQLLPSIPAPASCNVGQQKRGFRHRTPRRPGGFGRRNCCRAHCAGALNAARAMHAAPATRGTDTRQGSGVNIIIITNGDKGCSATFCHNYTSDQIAVTRRAEALAAAAALGVKPMNVRCWSDSRPRAHAALLPGAHAWLRGRRSCCCRLQRSAIPPPPT